MLTFVKIILRDKKKLIAIFCRLAQKILENLNTKISPCDNFYEYACGNFAQDLDPATFGGTIRAMDLVQEEINKKLELALLEPPKSDDIAPYTLAKRLYNLCINYGKKKSLKNFSLI